MSPHTLALYLASATAVALAPGPDILTVLTRSVTQGRAAGIAAALGFATGLIAHTAAAALGLAVLLQQTPAAYAALRLAGAAYLVYLALRMAFAKDALSLDAAPAARRPLLHIYGQSILMNILNPKVTLFFLAFLPPFADRTSSVPLPWQMVLLGALFAFVTITCFCAVALVAGRLSARLRHNPRHLAPLRWLTAALFLLLATQLAFA
jgi:threonine/homoserine/homoserine lactone efflux protein